MTGSGKTEVYLRAAERTLAAGRSVLVLVPEIALTPQIVARFRERFGDTVAVLHSALAPGARYDEWLRLRRGEARICVGPRSAVFAPLERIGLIVVDEEHDASYKHEGDPRYDARHVAARRARDHGAVLVAGSATPRAESWQRAAAHHARRARRRRARCRRSRSSTCSACAARCTRARTRRSSTRARRSCCSNRRGWSNYLTCGGCGRAWECPDCDVTLVLHRAERDARLPPLRPPRARPDELPGLRLGLDRPPRHRHRAAGRGAPGPRLPARRRRPRPGARVLAAFERADRGILLGTQMVAKGHDFPDVELGVVVDADQTLRFPDFRAEERTFALVAQLAGRAGPRRRAGPRDRADARARRAADRAAPRGTTPPASSPASSSAARRCATRRSRR